MRTILFLFVVIIIASCSKEKDRPLNSPPLLELCVFVQNKNGDDLLNPDTKGNVRDSCDIFHYNTKYPLKQEDIIQDPNGKFYMSLVFFPDENNYQAFVLMWDDKTTDIISCDKMGNEIFLNGEEVVGNEWYKPITIIR